MSASVPAPPPWYWQNDAGEWCQYESKVCAALEEVRRLGPLAPSTVIKLSDISSSHRLARYSVEVPAMIQENTRSGVRRKVWRGDLPNSSVVWQFKNKNEWWPFAPEACEVLNTAFASGQVSVDLSTGSVALPYKVDVQHMVQENVLTGFKRRIRRAVISNKPPSSLPSLPTTSTSLSQSGVLPMHGRASALLPSQPGTFGVVSGGVPAPTASMPTAVVGGITGRQAQAGGLPAYSSLFPGSSSSAVQPTSISAAPTASIASSLASTALGPSGAGSATATSASGTNPPPAQALSLHQARTRQAAKAAATSARPSPAAAAAAAAATARADAAASSASKKPRIRQRKAGVDLGLQADIANFCEAIEPEDDDEDCPICMCELSDSSSYSSGTTSSATAQAAEIAVELSICKHTMHLSCLKQMLHVSKQVSGFPCPVCKEIHGVHTGIQPKGDMRVSTKSSAHCAGYPNAGLITIEYHISPGVQGPEHPHPGKRFSTSGFPRVAYLPDTPGGQKILKMLQVAWKRRLIFTVGTSSTSGAQDTVTWNEIHHKTEYAGNHSGHGYPDDTYFARVTGELAAQGVTVDDIS